MGNHRRCCLRRRGILRHWYTIAFRYAHLLNHVRLTGLQIIQRNYLDVFPYDKWNGKHIPDFNEGEEFMPSVCELREGLTTRPTLLTEADLVGLMDKNGIGQSFHVVCYRVCLTIPFAMVKGPTRLLHSIFRRLLTGNMLWNVWRGLRSTLCLPHWASV